MYGIGFNARSAVPLNLLTSLVTLTFALAIRSGAISVGVVVPYLPEMAGLLAGGIECHKLPLMAGCKSWQ
jgi:hypothetical protein